MSTPEDKASAKGSAGPARCKLEHLQAQFGFRVLSGPESRPERVEVSHPGYFAPRPHSSRHLRNGEHQWKRRSLGSG